MSPKATAKLDRIRAAVRDELTADLTVEEFFDIAKGVGALIDDLLGAEPGPDDDADPYVVYGGEG